MSKSSPVVLVTGASSGLGAAMATRFRAAGSKVIGVSRSKPSVALDGWCQADITVPADRERVAMEGLAAFGALDVLINNAGVGLYETWEESAEADLRRMFELNFFAMVLLTQRLLPALKQSRGTVINTASIAGKVPVACMGGYCASKYAVTAYSDTLRQELQPAGVHVINLIVGRIHTNFGSNIMGTRKSPSTPELGHATPAGLAEAVYAGWRKRRREVVYPGWYGWLPLVARWLPGQWDRGNRRKWGLE